MLDATVDSAEVERAVAELAAHGAHGATGVWRPVYSPAWVAAQACVAAWGRDAGLRVRRDTVGNVWIELEGRDPAGGVVATGSHIDSQLPGGRYDGALGVIGGVIALRTLAARCGQPRQTLAAVSLCEEESSRFNASMWGSRAVIGGASAADAEAIRDADGVTLAAAMRAVALDPARVADAARSDLDAFIELHIEQGPLLEQAGVPLGIVESITGIRHYELELTGRADHAGARPIDDRRDALAGAAEIISRVGSTARRFGRPAVTTVGHLEVWPNIAAAVAERAELTIDVRHPDAGALARLASSHEHDVAEVASTFGLEVTRSEVSLDLAPTLCAPRLVDVLSRAAAEEGTDYITLHSGAAHDSQRLATVTDVAMLFVRSQDGRSHTPEEFTSGEDTATAVSTLIRALHALAY